MRLARLAACAAALAACSSPGEKSDWEREHEERLQPSEEELVLPTYPKNQDLLEFLAGPPGELRFFIDSMSIHPGKDGIVRYTLVARSAAGSQNVSYEGIRCSTGELRIYAVGTGGDWIVGKTGWRAIQPGNVQRWHYALYREYLCPLRQPVAGRREAIENLRRKPVIQP